LGELAEANFNKDELTGQQTAPVLKELLAFIRFVGEKSYFAQCNVGDKEEKETEAGKKEIDSVEPHYSVVEKDVGEQF